MITLWDYGCLEAAGFEVFTALSYLSIPLAIQYLRMSMKHAPPPVIKMHALLQVFIIGCAILHFLLPLASVYYIANVIQQILKVVTPLFAVLTSSSIYLMIPHFLSIPSPCQLQQLNQELQQHRDNLHKEVAQRTHELMQEKAKWKMVAEQSPQILWLKNTKGRIEFYNKKWYQYTGLSPDEENSACGTAVHPVDRELMHTKWVEGQCSQAVSDYKIRIKAASGEYRWHIVRCVPLRDIETNEIIQYCGISTDIHDTEMVNELSMADATRKSRFLAMISHEMRTPLTGIIGMSTLLGDTQLQVPQVEILNNVKSSADKLLNLVNNILDLFKMHNDKLKLEVSTFELQDCVQETLSSVGDDAFRKQITIHDEIDHSLLPSLVQADRVRLKQVLSNLLSNAVKFTHEGGHIYISAFLDQSDSRSLVRFSIRDTGIGISEGDMAKVFETFSQLDTSSTRRFGGTGVGLAISKGLVELMRGTIWCESKPGEGATFYFTFEVADVTNESVVRSGSAPPIASTPLLYASSCDDMVDSNGLIISNISPTMNDVSASLMATFDVSESDDDAFVCIIKPKILVVDDTEMNQKVLKRFLTSLGYTNVDAVYNGQEAVKAVTSNQYDVIFMDMEMPVMDGVTASKQIRQLPHAMLSKQPHIIAVTANAFQEDVEKCLGAGMCLHMSKPLKRDDLKKKMERSLLVLCKSVECACHQYQHPHHHHHHNNTHHHNKQQQHP